MSDKHPVSSVKEPLSMRTLFALAHRECCIAKGLGPTGHLDVVVADTIDYHCVVCATKFMRDDVVNLVVAGTLHMADASVNVILSQLVYNLQ